jgi:ADP-ribose pyrophosphatase YjhB (NUDIX family)
MADEIVGGPTVICSAFIEKEGKFLMVLCPRFKVWRVPGGRSEFSETLEEALIREMKEEIGVGLKNPKFVGWGQDHQYHVKDKKETSRLLMFFHVIIEEEPAIDPDEAEEYKWVTFEELKKHSDKEGALTDLFRRNPNLRL